MKRLLQACYYRFGGYQAVGEPEHDNTVPRFSVFHARDQDDVFGRKPRQWLEERVELIFPGTFNRPAFRVTDLHRKRWPKQYAAFRASVPWLTKVKMWWWAWRNPPVMPEPHDSALDELFGRAIEKASAEMSRLLDTDIRADFDAAIRKHQEKMKS